MTLTRQSMGFVQPCSLRRAQGCGASLLGLLLAACGDHSDRSPRSSSIEDVGASSIEDVGGGQSGNEGEGNLPYDGSDVVGEGETARSFIQLGRLGPASMVRPLLHVYREGRDGGPPNIGLNFQALFSQELMLTVELPYLEGEADLSLPFEAAMYLNEGLAVASSDKVATSGNVLITPTDAGARIDLEDIVMRVGDGTAEETLGDGVIEGEVERMCFYLAIVPEAVNVNTGMPYPEHVRDETWSSPFCAQYR
jgi:hypothetical protein